MFRIVAFVREFSGTPARNGDARTWRATDTEDKKRSNKRVGSSTIRDGFPIPATIALSEALFRRRVVSFAEPTRKVAGVAGLRQKTTSCKIFSFLAMNGAQKTLGVSKNFPLTLLTTDPSPFCLRSSGNNCFD